MRKSAFLSLVVFAIGLMVCADAWSAGPPRRGGGPGPGVQNRGPVRNAPAMGQHQMNRGPAMGMPSGSRSGNPAVHLNQGQVRQQFGLPTAHGNVATSHGLTPAQWQQRATAYRGQLHGRYNNLFTSQWYAHHPNAWRYRHPHADMWAAVAAWPVLANWVGVAGDPYEYGYGYTNGTYYIDDQPVAADEYITGVTDLASQGQTGQTTTNDGDWLPLGVFAITSPNSTSTPNRLFQIAVNKNGQIAGTYYDTLSGQTLPIQGTIDKKAQRAAWTVGSNKDAVMETKLGSFVEDQGVVMVHQGKDQTEEWMMVRLENPNSTTSTTSTGSTTSTNPTTPSTSGTPTNPPSHPIPAPATSSGSEW